ncbi:hypothetical protein HPP92_016806 [Vanilla planifolia]|uniref:VOC domain-containing protein n=1 Tax=Vanilla planifolia TaxID=51239 RepID=A0A835QKV0_VANPL|nr:hypothetical protein HPP92_016806 [Vanilla planifolia]
MSGRLENNRTPASRDNGGRPMPPDLMPHMEMTGSRVERIEAPNFGDIEVIWLRISPELSLHLIQRSTVEAAGGPLRGTTGILRHPIRLLPAVTTSASPSPISTPSFNLSRQDKGIETFLTRQPEGKTKQLFFFDVDGNGLEVVNREN